ncbi:MAG TPA: HAD family hydrolase [Limnochordia bacterium]
MDRLDAVIFDFDGLILDTETPEYEAWSELYREHGVELTVGLWGQAVGAGWGEFDAHAYLERCLGRRLDRARLRERYEARKTELIAAQTIRPGVRERLAEARALGLGIGLASSSPRHWVAMHLERLGLLKAFDTLCTADDVARVKPAPELYLLAAERLGTRPARCLALEDSPNGARAAKAAGCFCVVVPNALTRQLPFDAGDLTLATLAEMDLAQIEARLPASPHE